MKFRNKYSENAFFSFNGATYHCIGYEYDTDCLGKEEGAKLAEFLKENTNFEEVKEQKKDGIQPGEEKKEEEKVEQKEIKKKAKKEAK